MLTGKDILALRNSLGMTPTDFGSMLGVCSTTIWLWENDKRYPRRKSMEKLNELAAEARNGKKKAVAR